MKSYTWMVWKNNRLVGYVVAFSEWDAYAKATKHYGSNLYVEKPWVEQYKNSVAS